MSAHASEPAPRACSEVANRSERKRAKATRPTIVIVSARALDAARLAKHLAETSRGAASVTLLSVDGTSNGAPIDYASTSARIWEHLGQCNRAQDARPDRDVCPNRAPDCADACNLPIALSDPIAGIGRGFGKSPSVPRTNGAAHFASDDRSSAGTASDPITVMIASDREGLLEVLLPRLASERDIKVLGDPVVDPARLPSCLEERLPRLLLLDKALLARVGPQLLGTIHTRFPEVRVLLLWHEVCHHLVEEILRNHFDGFLLTSCAPDAYVKAIRAVSRGELWLPRALLAKAICDLLRAPEHGDSRSNNDRPPDAADSLTHRERQIVELLRRGFTNKEIARQLGIREDTVKKHLQSVFAKYGVHRRTLVLLRQVSGQFNPL